jgi:hypothetical protein
MKYFSRPPFFELEEPAMITNYAALDGFEISPKFRQALEARIARLEADAKTDEDWVAVIDDPDHIRRQMRLVLAQRTEALRMRLFLERAKSRLPRPLIEL